MLLTLDAGASSTKWALFAPDGTLLDRGRLDPVTGHLFTPADRERVTHLLAGLASRVPHAPDTVVMGVTGLQGSAHPLLLDALGETFRLPATRLHVTDDLSLAYAAHFRPGEGVLVYAGTGSMAMHLTRDRHVIRAGGHGFLLGDEGGAFWQGRAGLRALLAQLDAGHAPGGPLADELSRMTGGLDWPALRHFVYQGGRTALATLAPAVHRAATLGDPYALQVTQDAGRHLAALAAQVQARLTHPLPVALAGGGANDLVREAFRDALDAHLGPLARHHPPTDPVMGGPRLAPTPAPLEDPRA
ncbi:N-acetylglucosamine kinase [Deinococcus aquiradiocola]|uniref:ATPase BadF/BadG/BcrA/BcrD type domain-containing protein n=1 Tax=Deinococcus aquiradiocola TaxID=393059 RepID=A0A917UNG0_9DEIO|nr:BadF/BadG/BcrA/BcrD ATPase family protein [Deinococcus aquiradiocola]GGJ70339.1 hypothetical protein GCM10008939_13400 [Deinococcus aquiradiocola]